MHQNNAVWLAPDRRNSSGFVDELQFIARRLLVSAIGLPEADRQFLWDVARGEGRYRMVALQRLAGISCRSVKPEDREALAELVRRECLCGVPSIYDVGLAFDLETKAQGEADVAQRQFERRPTLATRTAAIETLTGQYFATRASLDAVEAERS